jgi:hypothetical protein
MADDWERLLDDFDHAVSQNAGPSKPSKTPTTSSLPPAPVKPVSFSFSVERRPSTDDLLKLVGSAPAKITPKPSVDVQKLLDGPSVSPAPPTPQAPPPEAAAAPRPLLEDFTPAPAVVDAPRAPTPNGNVGLSEIEVETVMRGVELRMSEMLRGEISRLETRLLDAMLATSTTRETKVREEISELKRGRLESEEKTREFVASEVAKIAEFMGSWRRTEETRKETNEENFRRVMSKVESQLEKRDKEDFARLAKEKESIISYKAEISGLLKSADSRVVNVEEILQDAKHELKRQLEIAEDERRRAAMELEQVNRLRRELEVERKVVISDRQAVEEQARKVAEKAQEIADAWRKAGEAREEVMQLCAEVEKEKELLVAEGERLEQLRTWIDGEKDQALRNSVRGNFQTSLAITESGTEGKWTKLRQEAENFHKMVANLQTMQSSLSLPSPSLAKKN